jgi:hypothetical protein
MRFSAALLCAALVCACGARGLFTLYEYEEEIYLSLDGSATVYVHSSIDALNALRGTALDANRIDRNAVRAYFTSPNTHVSGRISQSRRSGRRFVHVRVDVDDVNRLGAAAPFAWSTYRFQREGDQFVFRQTVSAATGKATAGAGWKGDEIVAFRLHLPSKIDFHNTERDIKRGNILVWEQSLGDRLRGQPLTLEARMQTESVLTRTLWLFAATFVAVAVAFSAVIWWMLKRPAAAAGSGHAV